MEMANDSEKDGGAIPCLPLADISRALSRHRLVPTAVLLVGCSLIALSFYDIIELYR